MKLDAVPVFVFRRRDGLDVRDAGKAAKPDKGVVEHSGFFLKLGGVGQVLKGTAAADAVEGAGRLNPFRRGPADFAQFRPDPGFVDFGDPPACQISRGSGVHKDGLAFHMKYPRSSRGKTLYRGGKQISHGHE
jgi:hypothetical protein